MNRYSIKAFDLEVLQYIYNVYEEISFYAASM